MILFTTPDEWQRLRAALYQPGSRVGFVPTMGALHDGHQTLFERAQAENQVCVGSVFVNPTQFNEQADLANYPRTLQSDIDVAAVAGCDLMFVPSVQTMYGDDLSAVRVSYGPVTDILEGALRPGHFDGVITIVRKLLSAIRPDVLYLGEKDFQQLAVIREMVRRENIRTEVRGCTLIRDVDGLALSSRNARLSSQGRRQALAGVQTLHEMTEKASYTSPRVLVEYGAAQLSAQPGVDLEYVEVIDEENFLPAEQFIPGKPYRALIAFRVDGVRLIDNVRIFE